MTATRRTIFVSSTLAHRHAAELRRRPVSQRLRDAHADAQARGRYLGHLFNGIPAEFFEVCSWRDVAPIVRRAAS